MSKAYITVQLDKMRNLRYGMRALETIEELTGNAIGKLDLQNLKMKDLKCIVYAGLVHEDKELTPDKVVELIDEYSDIQSIADSVGKAMTEAFGKNVKGVAKKGNGTGNRPIETLPE